jgi:hypothetical protein
MRSGGTVVLGGPVGGSRCAVGVGVAWVPHPPCGAPWGAQSPGSPEFLGYYDTTCWFPGRIDPFFHFGLTPSGL